MNYLIITGSIAMITTIIGHIINYWLVNRRNNIKELKVKYANVYSGTLSKMILYINIRFTKQDEITVYPPELSRELIIDIYESAKLNSQHLNMDAVDDLYHLLLEEIDKYSQIQPEYFYIKLINSLFDNIVSINKEHKVISDYLLSNVLFYSILCKLYILLQHELHVDEIDELLKGLNSFVSRKDKTSKLMKVFKRLKRHVAFPIDYNSKKKNRDVLRALNYINRHGNKRVNDLISKFEGYQSV